MVVVGGAVPNTQVRGIEVELTESFGALLVTRSVMFTGRSAYPETFR
jgi:hypothetical protein